VHERFDFVRACLSTHLMMHSFNVSLSHLPSRETPTIQKLVGIKASCNLTQFPRWHFPLEESQSHASTGGPLYLGSLPHKPAEQYFAVLPLRPPPDHKVSTSHCCSCSTCCCLGFLSKLFTHAAEHCHGRLMIGHAARLYVCLLCHV